MADLKVNRISASEEVDEDDGEEALMVKTRRNMSESESVQ